MIGKGIVKGLEISKASRPTDVAYVSLFSLSLGSKPPLIRKIEITDSHTASRGNKTSVAMIFDIDALLDGMSLVLGKSAQ